MTFSIGHSFGRQYRNRTRSKRPIRKEHLLQRRQTSKPRQTNQKVNLQLTFKLQTQSCLLNCKHSWYHATICKHNSSYLKKLRILKDLISAQAAWAKETEEQCSFRELLEFEVEDSFLLDTRAMSKHLAREASMRFQFRRIFNQWIKKHYANHFFNDTDPITLSSPITRIQLFLPNQRGSYQFEASSLLESINTSLCHHEYLFPDPKLPKNPLTNLAFTIPQLLALTNALRSAGKSSWQLEGFLHHKCNLSKFKLYFLQAIRHVALQHYLQSCSDEAIEHCMDFIEFMYDHLDLWSPSTLAIINWGIHRMPSDPYIKSWKNAYKRYYEIHITYPALPIYDSMFTPVIQNIETLMSRSADIQRIGLERILQSS